MHGIPFGDYAATNAIFAQGKPLADLLPTLDSDRPSRSAQLGNSQRMRILPVF